MYRDIFEHARLTNLLNEQVVVCLGLGEEEKIFVGKLGQVGFPDNDNEPVQVFLSSNPHAILIWPSEDTNITRL